MPLPGATSSSSSAAAILAAAAAAGGGGDAGSGYGYGYGGGGSSAGSGAGLPDASNGGVPVDVGELEALNVARDKARIARHAEIRDVNEVGNQ